MKYIMSLALVAAVSLTSCKNETETSVTKTTPTNVVPFTEVGNQMKSQQQVAATEASPVSPSTTVAGMNPAHGQPGHRCEIPVGAPLNTPSSTTKPVVTTANPTVTTAVAPNVITQNPVVTTPTAEGMNPPHGQTNHRCDIAVGAPLPKA
ncbi:hypothetical protein SAMN05444396_105254 [Flavobacterium segetis]|uniref:Secreted protein n=1 Tax=Flavobacterium segetis TaxID=271157 RepID=A0A1M5HQL9_9FLAO|nr:hypothetical protein [Flavobacterium segetis]SHG18259.1 hypothetical protein SAMN05444396_105254 [Flavobacterium segetis]